MREHLLRIDEAAVYRHREVQVRASDAASAPDLTDQLTLQRPLADVLHPCAQVHVDAHDAAAVIDHDGVPSGAEPPRVAHDAGLSGEDAVADLPLDVRSHVPARELLVVR